MLLYIVECGKGGAAARAERMEAAGVIKVRDLRYEGLSPSRMLGIERTLSAMEKSTSSLFTNSPYSIVSTSKSMRVPGLKPRSQVLPVGEGGNGEWQLVFECL